MALLCYNKGCGLKFDAKKNKEDSCVFHPGVPIFHDALKGWSCCRKRTTDFSEFLSIKGCTRGRHSGEKPQEPLRPEVTSDKEMKHTNGEELIYRGPKSAEALQKERPSSDEPKTRLPHKVSASLAQVLLKLDISKKAEEEKKEGEAVRAGTRCKNAGCKSVYQGPETDTEVCTHHPGAPVFHEGYKYWNCCCIRTIDFNAFLDQKGCNTGKHRWIPKQDKKKVACRYDWHQTGNDVVVTIYAKNANPQLSSIEANGTVLSCQIQFENEKVFKRDFHFWGVVNVKQSSVNMVPTKVEITLHKADQVAWGKLEDPNYKPEPEPEEDSFNEPTEPQPNDYDIDDNDISDSDEEWNYDTGTRQKKPWDDKDGDDKKKEEEQQILQTKEVEEEMKKALEEKQRAEEEKRKLEEERRQEAGGGYEDMPELE